MPDHPDRREGSGMTTDPVARLAKNWWLFLVLGVVSLIAGILAIAYPDLTLLALGIFAGISLLMIGIVEVVEAIAGDPESRALTAIVGVLSLLAGLVCVRRPGESLLALVIVLGFWLIIEGVVRFVGAFGQLEDRALRLGLAILDIILGILILALPHISLVTLAILFAISLIVRGLFAIITAFRLRGLEHEPGAAAPA
jgi:uncharacterized membrane protein HdeD (DUF308 family)